MIKTNVPVHDGSLITWSGRVGSIEASSLRGQIDGRVALDSCDVGFYVTSPATGSRKLFVLSDISLAYGDAVSTRYESSDGFAIEIFND